jgi:hypothetical protein
VRLERACVDHHRFGCRALGGRRREDAVERADPAPALDAALQGLVRTAGGGGASAHQSASDEMDDAADHLPVSELRHASWLIGEKWLQALKPSVDEPEMAIMHGKPLKVQKFASQPPVNGNPLRRS